MNSYATTKQQIPATPLQDLIERTVTQGKGYLNRKDFELNKMLNNILFNPDADYHERQKVNLEVILGRMQGLGIREIMKQIGFIFLTNYAYEDRYFFQNLKTDPSKMVYITEAVDANGRNLPYLLAAYSRKI